MILFLSDLHLGRGSEEQSRRAELDAVELLETYRPILAARNGEVVLLGDVFNAYMEYGTMAPPGFLRFRAELARCVDAGVTVWYVLGNRDHWQVGHLERATGVRVVPRSVQLHRFGDVIHCEHGDALMRGNRPFRIIRPVLRSRAAYFAYRTLLPGDFGFRLARYLGSRGSGEAEQWVIDDMRRAARKVLATTDATTVALGHSHFAETVSFPEGAYLNPGYWLTRRTYAVMTLDGPTLYTWPERFEEATAKEGDPPQQPHRRLRSRHEP